MMAKKKKKKRRIYIYIHTQEHADSSLREQILERRRELSFEFFFVHIHTYIHIDANLSDEDDVDKRIVRSFRPSYDLINNSLFVHIRLRRYTLKVKETFFILSSFFIASMISIAHMLEIHTHANARDPTIVQCIFHHWTYVALVELSTGRRSSTHFRSLMFLLFPHCSFFFFFLFSSLLFFFSHSL